MIFSKEEPYESPETCFFGLFSLFLPHQPPVFRPETLPMKPIPICRVLAALLLLPLFACGPDGVVPRRTVIAGRVVDLAGEASGAVLFNTEDPFALKSRMAARVSPEANDFHFVFRTAYTTGMTGIYGDFFDLIVSPGDSVYVTIDAGRMRAGDPDAIRFSGDHARTNNALASVAGLKRRLCEQAPAVEGDPQEYLASYRRYRQAVADSLSARRLPAEVREAVARDIDMVQIWNHDLDPAAWRAIFTDPMFDIFDLERNMVSVINYSAGISYYLGAICPDEIEAVRSGAAPAEALAAVAARLDADPQIGRGLRDYLLYGCMEGMRANGAVPAERMAGLFLDPAYAARVRERAAERPAFSTVPLSGVLRCDAAGRIDTLPDCELLSTLAARHPGKALYVDFCSTWCGPCRSELKTAMPILREHYAGSDEVRFVTLCLRSRRKAWIEFLDEFGLTGLGENYFLPDAASSLTLAEYDLSGFPTYMLIAPDGRLATCDAPRPSQFEAATEAIDALLAGKGVRGGEK